MMDLRLIVLQLSFFFIVIVAKQLSVVAFDEKCTTSTNEVGSCVYQYQCVDGLIVDSGVGIIDIRLAGDQCNDYFLVCCKDGDTANDMQTTVSLESAVNDNDKWNSTTTSSQSEDLHGSGEAINGTNDQTTDIPQGTVTSVNTIGKPWQSAPIPPYVTNETVTEVDDTRTPSSAGREPSPTRKPVPPPQLPEYRPQGCGQRNPNGVVFSIENNVHSECEYGEFPWVAAVFARGVNNSLKYLCVGALIDPSAILTTASCLHGYRMKTSQLVVRLGEWDMSTGREPIRHIDSVAESIQFHPAYGVSTKINDIAVVILQDTLELGHTVGVVCLPPANHAPSGGDLIGAGWGNVPPLLVPKKLPQSIVKKAHLQYRSKEECQITMNRLMGRRFELHDSFICATASDTEMLPCQGDSGSPYVVEITGGSDRYYLAGLSTWGYDCRKQSLPTVLTNVAYHREWIDGVMKAEHLGSWSYTYQSDETFEEE